MTLPSSLLHQVARNAVLLFAAQIATKIIGFATGLLLAHYLNVEQFGTYGFVIAFASLFIPLCDIGVDTFVVREIAARPHYRREFTGTALLSKSVLSVFTFFIIIGTIQVISPESEKVEYVVLAAAITVLRTFSATFTAFFRGYQKMGYEANSTIVAKIFEIAALLIGIAVGFSLFQLLLLLLVAASLQFMYTGFLAVKFGFLGEMEFDRTKWKFLLKGGIPFALTGLSVNIYFQIDSVMLSFMIGDEAVGLYRSVYNIVFALSGFSAAVVTAIFPMIAQSYKHDLSNATKAARNAIVYSLMLALPMAVGGTVLSERIVGALYPQSYSDAALTLQILVWWIPLVYTTGTLGHVLGAANLQRMVLGIAVLNSIFNLSLNFALIPVLHENGAAIATVLTELLGLIMLSFIIKRRFGRIYDAARIMRILFANVVFLPLLSLPSSFSLVPVGLAAAFAYVAVLFILKVLSADDLRTMKQLILTRTRKKQEGDA